MTLLLALPGAVPQPEVDSRWVGLRPTWTGWDGSVWELTGEDSGVRLIRGGTRGLGRGEHDRFASSSPAVAGSRYRGHRTLERDVFWPLLVFVDDSSEAWVKYDRAFWRTMHPDRPGTWTVTHPDGARRTLTCRYDGTDNQAFDRLPVQAGWAVYGVRLVADEQPFWQGEPIARTFQASPGSPFLPGPPFTISSGSTLALATIDNPGDEPAYPIWDLEGPLDSVTVGVDGRTIEVPIELAAGETLRVDPRPTEQTAIDGTGADRTAELGAVDFAPVAPGEQVPLTLAAAGTGSITATLIPLYARAW